MILPIKVQYQGELFVLDNKWGWLTADFIAVNSDLRVKLNQQRAEDIVFIQLDAKRIHAELGN